MWRRADKPGKNIASISGFEELKDNFGKFSKTAVK